MQREAHTQSGLRENPAYDYCIIGAGVAGAALAAFLTDRGKHIAVIEKDFSEQNRIVGELLQPGGVEKLRELGLEDCLEEIDSAPVSGYAIFKEGKEIRIPYPGVHLQGRGFHNGRFVQKLRAKITGRDNVTLLEGTAAELLKDTGGKITGVRYADRHTDDEHEVKASVTLISDGFFSQFRKELSHNKATVSGFFLGLILKHARLPHPGHGHVFITDTSPFLVYPISSFESRMLIDFPGSMPPKKGPLLKEELRTRILPFLAPSLHEAFLQALEEGDFKVMPNHYMPGMPLVREGAVLLGDALNMRHPLTGGGMTASFSDVLSLGQLLTEAPDNADSKDMMLRVKRFYFEKRNQNSTINILADALYRVFRHKPLADACFDYLAQGGAFAQEPVSILSGISRDKDLLVKHFFAVARFGAWNLLKKRRSPGEAYSMIRHAFRIVYPLLKNERPNRVQRLALEIGNLLFPEFKK
jgi:squalene monooxygenase